MAGATAPPAHGIDEFGLWGGTAVVAVTEEDRLAAAVAQVRRVVDAFDLACSSFREDSELARLNRSPARVVAVGPLLLEAIRAALRAAQLTGGAVDPTVGEALFAHRINPSGGAGEFRVRPAPGYAVVSVDEATQSVLRPPGVQLDLGATAKGLAADLAAKDACAMAGCGVLVSLCGDIAVAGTPPPGGWGVRVTDDHRRGDGPGQNVAIREGGLATSSTTVRHSGTGADAVHHLIDPVTGRPTCGPWRTVSVTAHSCVDANTASTAAIVLGEAAPDWLEHHGFPARLVDQAGQVRHLAGWPPDGDEQ